MSAAKRRELEKERRRTDILNTAEQLFFLKGFENVSLNDIAKELQLADQHSIYTLRIKKNYFLPSCLEGL
ncbi:TetR family transcriptional regulator [Methanobacterium sp. SMA-27]|uniref:TetR family transcriptional regulator n=1 Tax=Methanobacterium sp. SMA-27 TaxID=1495336 RepID=UPI000693E9A2|nr:TetR family transcriptional regulator [Methanobacterium sp. SMA-27]